MKGSGESNPAEELAGSVARDGADDCDGTERLDSEEVAESSDGEIVEDEGEVPYDVRLSFEKADGQVEDDYEGEGVGLSKAKTSDTLFFPSVPSDVSEDELRKLCEERGANGVEKIRLTQKEVQGFSFVWVTFRSSANAVTAINKLRGVEVRRSRRLLPIFHIGLKKAPSAAATKPPPREKIFREKAKKVLKKGGTACTLLVRGIPSTFDADLVEKQFAEAASGLVRVRSSDAGSLPTSMFSMDMEENELRKYWLTYSNAEQCHDAFMKLAHLDMEFEPETKTRLKVSLHDDTTDAHHFSRKGRIVENNTKENGQQLESSGGVNANRGRARGEQDGDGQEQESVKKRRRSSPYAAGNLGGGGRSSTSNRGNPRFSHSKKPCRFFLEGDCRKGVNCTFSHDNSGEREPG